MAAVFVLVKETYHHLPLAFTELQASFLSSRGVGATREHETSTVQANPSEIAMGWISLDENREPRETVK